jgi:hypothetical protein
MGIIHQVLGYQFNLYILSLRIIRYEIERQNLIYRELKTEIHQDLENIISEYDSKIITFIKDNLIKKWKDYIKDDWPDEWKKIDMSTIINAIENEIIETELNDMENKIIQYLFSISFDILKIFELQIENDDEFLQMQIFLNSNEEYVLGYLVSDFSKYLGTTSLDIQYLNKISEIIQKKLRELKILSEDEIVELHIFEEIKNS